MVKAVERGAVITDLRLEAKSGGKSGNYQAGHDPDRPRPPPRRPAASAGRRYGLLAHGASVTRDVRPAHRALAASPTGPPAALFGPEHGYYGIEQDMVAAASETDPWTGAPIVSLYGESEDSLRPCPCAFAGLDLLVIDLQDVGSRYYTYAATAVWAAEAALAAGCEVWVLDRPNPLGRRGRGGQPPGARLRILRRRLPHARAARPHPRRAGAARSGAAVVGGTAGRSGRWKAGAAA